MTPLLGLVVGFLTGDGVALWADGDARILAVAFVIGPGLLVVSGRLTWGGHHRAALWVAVTGAALCGVARGRIAALEAWTPPGLDVEALERRSADGALVVIEGTLRHDAAPSSGGASLDIRIDRVEIDGLVHPTDVGARVSVGGAQVATHVGEWTRGRRVRAPVSSIRRPLPYLNFGMPDAERDLARRSLRVFASVKSASLVEWRHAVWWEEGAASVRRHVRAAVRRATPSETTAAVVIAILIGDRTGLAPDQERRLQEAGTYHVIAISGGNVALWLGLMAWLPRWRRASVRWGTAVLGLSLLVFALCVDGGASVGRASCVAALWLAARWWDLRTSALQATSGAAGIIVLSDPLALHDPGFLLSFGATIALIVMTLRLQARARRIAGERSFPLRALSMVGLVVLATASVELVLMPIAARWFSLVTGIGLVANLFALPAMACVQGAGLAIVALDVCSLHTLARLIAYVADGAVAVLLGSSALVDVAPALVRHVPPPTVGTVLAYFTCLAVCLWSTWPRAFVGRTYRRWVGATTGAGAFAVLAMIVWGGPGGARVTPWTWGVAKAVQVATWPADRWLVLTFLDVGQGDATLLQFPNGRTWLVDAGGAPADSAFDLGARVTVPAIWALGHRRLDRAVLTHGHADHGGALPTVLRRLLPRELMVGVPVVTDLIDARVLDTAASLGMPVRRARAGERFVEGRVAVRVLHPPPPDWERVQVRNDDSLVLWLQYGEVGVLLSGDAGRDAERPWPEQVSARPLVLIKAGHHGSRTSTSPELLHHFVPSFLLTSSGRGNRFGHPHADVLARAQQAGASLWRTDVEGAVQVATNGHVLVVRSARGRVEVRRPASRAPPA